MNKVFWLAVLSLSVVMPIAANESASPVFRVVPGSGAGYVYFPSSSDANSVLKVSKTGEFKGYEIFIEVDGATPELLCSETDETCSRTLGPVVVKLTLVGNFPYSNLPVRVADWLGDCAKNASDECTVAMMPGQNALVSVTTGCDGSNYSLTRIGEDDVLCVGLHQNMSLVAAHRDMATNKLPKDRSGSWGNDNNNDGRTNMQALISNFVDTATSSAHYCQGMRLGGRSDWYLPADNELNVVLGIPATELHGVVYSSTAGNTSKKSFANKGMKYTSSGKVLQNNLSGKGGDGEERRTLCFIRVS